jgi:hypothetical protein
MLSHTLKTHRGRTPREQMDSLCIKKYEKNAHNGFFQLLNDRSAHFNSTIFIELYYQELFFTLIMVKL